MNDINGRKVILNDLIKVTLYNAAMSEFYVVAIGLERDRNWVEGLIVNGCDTRSSITLKTSEVVLVPEWYHIEVVGNTGGA